MFRFFLMMINIIIVFGLHILYLYIAIGGLHFSFACFNQCNNFDSCNSEPTLYISGIDTLKDTFYQHVLQL